MVRGGPYGQTGLSETETRQVGSIVMRLFSLSSLVALTGCWPLIPGSWEDYDTASPDDTADTSDSVDTFDSADTTDTAVTTCVDPWEPNDSEATARTVTRGSTTSAALCPGDTDWYRLAGAVGCRVDVALGGPQALGLGVLEEGGFATFGNLGGASVAWIPSESPIHLEVTHATGLETPYTMALSGACPGVGVPSCPSDDVYEPNDDVVSAPRFLVGTELDAVICPNDVDVYYVGVVEACTLEAELTFDGGAGDLDLYLYSANGVLLAQSISASSVERVSWDVVGSGFFRLDVEGYLGDSGPYTLATWMDCGGDTCDDAFEPNDTLGAAAEPALPLDADLILCPPDADWFSFAADDGCVIDAVWSGDGPVDVVMGPADDLQPYAPSSAGAQRWVVQGEPILLAASTTSTDDVTYALEVDARCSDNLTCPSNDVFEPNGDGATAPLLPAQTAIDGVICASEKDFFRVPMGIDCHVGIDLSFLHSQGDLDLRLRDEAGAVVDYSLGISNLETISRFVQDPGVYQIEVFAGGVVAQNAYALSVEADCAAAMPSCVDDDRFEPNDDPGDATPVLRDDYLVAVSCDDHDRYAPPTTSSFSCLKRAWIEAKSGGPFTLEWVDADDRVVASTSSSGGLPADALIQGAVQARVSGATNGVYRLTVAEPYCNTTAYTCGIGDPWEPNDAPSQALAVAFDSEVEGRACGEQDWFAVAGRAGCTLTATLAHLHADGDLALEVQDATGNLAFEDTASDDEVAQVVLSADGPVQIGVVPALGVSNRYTLTATLDCP